MSTLVHMLLSANLISASSLAIFAGISAISCGGAFTLKCETRSSIVSKAFERDTVDFLGKVFRAKQCVMNNLPYKFNDYMDCIYDLNLPERYQALVEEWQYSNTGNKISFKRTVLAAGDQVCKGLNDIYNRSGYMNLKNSEVFTVSGGIEYVNVPKVTPTQVITTNKDQVQGHSDSTTFMIWVMLGIILVMFAYILVLFIRNRRRANAKKLGQKRDEASIVESLPFDTKAPPSYDEVKQ